MSMKNSNDTIGNQTRDLLPCNTVPQPTASPHARIKLEPTKILGWHSSVSTVCVLLIKLPDTHVVLFATMSKNWHWVAPDSYPMDITGNFCSGKAIGCEVHNRPQTIVKVDAMRICNFTPHIFMTLFN